MKQLVFDFDTADRAAIFKAHVSRVFKLPVRVYTAKVRVTPETKNQKDYIKEFVARLKVAKIK